MIKLFKPCIKHLIYILILAMMTAGSLCAQPTDSIEVDIKSAVVNAGWLRDWRGTPTQWLDINGGSAEVSGYPTVDRKIRLFNNFTFELDVYKEPSYYYLTQPSLNGVFPCRSRQDNEVSVLTGTWSVKSDSIYLVYKKESFYDFEQYSEYQSLRSPAEPDLHRPKVGDICTLRRKETYLWQNRKLCMAGSVDICFK